jgi:hypothetical protein
MPSRSTGKSNAGGFIDGFLRRAVKSKQFEHHDPEIFGACSLLIILATVAAALACRVPPALHPLAIAIPQH